MARLWECVCVWPQAGWSARRRRRRAKCVQAALWNKQRGPDPNCILHLLRCLFVCCLTAASAAQTLACAGDKHTAFHAAACQILILRLLHQAHYAEAGKRLLAASWEARRGTRRASASVATEVTAHDLNDVPLLPRVETACWEIKLCWAQRIKIMQHFNWNHLISWNKQILCLVHCST